VLLTFFRHSLVRHRPIIQIALDGTAARGRLTGDSRPQHD